MLKKKILLPPPNITGSLHLGHAFQQIIMDVYARYQKSQGHEIEWIPGVDHAGIAFQMQVERFIKDKGLSEQDRTQVASDMLRENRRLISYQMQRMGISVDWHKSYYTKDDKFSHAVHEAFILLRDKGLIYKAKRPVYWDSSLRTVVSDSEAIHKEVPGTMYTIKYLLDDGHMLHVATTRPETMFGDVAVAVNKQDDRYQHLVGKKVKIPLLDKWIPIIASNKVEVNKGTGCLKVTPAHDFLDFHIGQEHNLPIVEIFSTDLMLGQNVPVPFRFLPVASSRDVVVQAVREKQLLVDERPIKHMVQHGERSGTKLEIITTDQWFIRTSDLAQSLNVNAIKFFPAKWLHRVQLILGDMKDWCISRQIWWGHRIPGQEDEVLDTWFSSALCPLVLSGWPNNFDRQRFDLLVTGFDILLFWVCRMIMLSAFCEDFIPFNKVMITGLIKDQYGHKMSKTKGNVIDPLDLIDGIELDKLIQKRTQNLHGTAKQETTTYLQQSFPDGIPDYGCDAVRLSFVLESSPSVESNFSFSRLNAAKAFERKIINACIFTKTHTKCVEGSRDVIESITKSFYQSCVLYQKQFRQNMDIMRFDLAAQHLMSFFYFMCDWYLEYTKVIKQFPAHYYLAMCALSYSWTIVLDAIALFMPGLALKVKRELESWLQHYDYHTLCTTHHNPDHDNTIWNLLKHIRSSNNSHKSTIILHGTLSVVHIATLRHCLRGHKIVLEEKPLSSYDTSYTTPQGTKFYLRYESEQTLSPQEENNLLAKARKLESILANPNFKRRAPMNLQKQMSLDLENIKSRLRR